MKQVGLMLSAVTVILLGLQAMAETYRYTPVDEFGYFGSWDNPSNWTDSAGVRASGYPRMPGDQAHIYGGGTNAFDNPWQLWPNNFTDVVANVGHIVVAISNNVLVGNSGADKHLVLNNPGKREAVWALTNMVPDNQYYVNDWQLATAWDLLMVLSNDLRILITSVPFESGGEIWTDAAGYAIDYDTTMVGNHAINVYGGGFLILGNYYFTPPNPAILTDKPLTLYGTYLILNESAIVKPPLVLYSRSDCQNRWMRSTMYGLGVGTPRVLTYNVDFVSRNGYMTTFGTWPTNIITPGGVYNKGSVTVEDWGLFAPYNSAGGLLQMACDVRGRGELWKGYSDTGGHLEFLGSISPGVNDIDYLYIRALTNLGTVSVGTKDDKVDLNIDVNGLRDWFAEDADAVVFRNIGDVNLGRIDLKLNVGSKSNPYRTNEIMYMVDGNFVGSFSSVTWVGGRTGEVIVTPQSIYVTGIPPATSNFFDIQPDRIILVQGQTQEQVTALSPFAVAVNVSNSEAWLTTDGQLALTPGTPVQSTITVPDNQPATNSWGFSRGEVWYTAANEPGVSYMVPVYVLRPGYFELNTRTLYFLAGQAGGEIVRVYSPLNVNVSAVAINAPWATVSPGSVSVNDSYGYIEVDVAAQAAGTTGTVRFTNTGVPTVQHDVALQFVTNGFFDTVEKELIFVQGETQKWFEAFAPFRADVTIAATNAPWIDVPEYVSMDGDAWLVPVTIPANQAVDSEGQIILQSECEPSITRSVKVTVVPEGGVVSLVAVVAVALMRRRV